MIAPRSASHVVSLLLAATGLVAACTDEFPLGGWDALPPENAGNGGSDASGGTGASGGNGTIAGSDASGGSGAAAGSAATGATGATDGTGGTESIAGSAGMSGNAGETNSAGTGSVLPACLEPGLPGPPNQPGGGMNIGATDTITDFVWPAPMDSLEWELLIEKPLETDGYYWMNQFSFTGAGTVGYFGMQERGGYNTVPNPTPRDYEFVKMVVFWISSPGVTQSDIPELAELGDISEPDARIMPDQNGNFITLHAKFEWEYCRTYRLRVGLESTEANGDRWIGAWILDVEADEETYFGRVRLPQDGGQFVPFNSFRTTTIERAPFLSCDDPEPASALFGWPTANLGTMAPSSRMSHFPLATRCGTSRFTLFPTAIRHELGIRR